MTHLAIIDLSPDENGEQKLTLVHNLGEVALGDYLAQMSQLTQAQDDWDSFCNTVLDSLYQAGILKADGFSTGGHTYNDLYRVLRDYFVEAEKKAKETRKQAGRAYRPTKFDDFLLGTEGFLIITALRGLAKIGQKGKDIVVNKDQAEAVFWALLEPVKRQLLRDPVRQQLLQPIIAHYFGAPAHVLGA